MNHQSTPSNHIENSFPFTDLLIRAEFATTGSAPTYPLYHQYFEDFWLPIIGPTTVLLLRQLYRKYETEQGPYWVNCIELSRSLGLGHRAGANGPLWRSIKRSDRFGLAALEANELRFALRVPILNTSQQSLLTTTLKRKHEIFTSRRVAA